MACYANALPGSSSQMPIIISNTNTSASASSSSATASTSNTKTMPSAAQWNAPTLHPLTTLESFAWPSMWFQLPSPTTTGAAPSSDASASTNMFPYVTDLECPELDHSKTPESSPISLYETCLTPSQDQDAPYVAICDVPLVAPRPLPFTPPTFLQFDHLPEEDEDLSFPPYTRSRRQQIQQASSSQEPSQNETQTQPSQSPADTLTAQSQSAAESRKRQRPEEASASLAFTSSHQTLVAPTMPGTNATASSGDAALAVGLQEHAAKRRKLFPAYPNVYAQPSIFLAAENSMWIPHQTYAAREPFFIPQLTRLNQGMVSTNWM